MKFLHLFSLFLVALVAYTSAQDCPGSPRNPSCQGPRHGGSGGRGCVPRTMWHYDSRTRLCHQMLYRGCGGNNNRWCSRGSCEQRCRRR